MLCENTECVTLSNNLNTLKSVDNFEKPKQISEDFRCTVSSFELLLKALLFPKNNSTVRVKNILFIVKNNVLRYE